MGEIRAIALGRDQAPDVLRTLKDLVASIEGGEISVETFYLVVFGDRHMAKGGSVTEPFTQGYDSNLTIAEAVALLEREKFRILCAADGVARPS